LLALAQI
jgi:hypothetical protein